MKKQILTITILALAAYGAYKGYKNIKAKGGIASAIGLKK